MNLSKYRTHNCGEINFSLIGSKIKLAGWVFRKRDHGGVLFVDLRDDYGVCQIVFGENEDIETISSIGLESVIIVEGIVRSRPKEAINESIVSGDVEIIVNKFVVENESDILKLSPSLDVEYSDELRMKYRFLDLRRESVKSAIVLRSKVIKFVRDYLYDLGFLEFQTPILSASSPEGARDFVVPSRVHKGKFYALPQAPQQFKQLIMMSGFDKYFQIAPCFRDEDARADRAPGEFYQIDLEMSFVDQEGIFQVVEGLMCAIFEKFSSLKISKAPFKRIKYDKSMTLYGTDKPDLRNPLFAVDVSEIFANSSFSIFANNIKRGKKVMAFLVKDIAKKPRSFFDNHIKKAMELGLSGMAYISYLDGEFKGPVAKFVIQDDNKEKLISKMEMTNDSVVFFISEDDSVFQYVFSRVRDSIAESLDIIDKNRFDFCWITDYPMYELDERGRLNFSHNPFSMPNFEGNKIDLSDPLKIRAAQYDLVCNGIELSSGAIRNHKLDIMYEVFSVVGYSQKDVNSIFPALAMAMKYGAPPHGGIAPGLDRIVMLLSGKSNVRDVICFPMNQKAELSMMGAPSEIDKEQLSELGIIVTKKPEKNLSD